MSFKTKNIDKETGKFYSMIKGTIHQEKKIIVNVYACRNII